MLFRRGILVGTYKAISDPIRRQILDLLKEKDLSLNEIVSNMNISQHNISVHLTILKNVGLITSEKSGRNIYYYLDITNKTERLSELKNILILIAAFFISLILWLSTYNSLPEMVIRHVGTDGWIEYAHKSFMFMIFMIISFGILLLFFGVTLIGMKSENENDKKGNRPIVIIASLLVVGINVFYILVSLYKSLNIESMFLVLIGCFLIIVGFYLPTIKYNTKVGIKNVASLKNEETWDKIQKFGGIAFIVAGILIGFTALIPSFVYALVATSLIIPAMVIIISIYSNKVSEKD